MADIERRLLQDDPRLDRTLSEGRLVRGSKRSLLYAGLLVLAFCLGVVTQQGSLVFVGVAGILFMGVRSSAGCGLSGTRPSGTNGDRNHEQRDGGKHDGDERQQYSVPPERSNGWRWRV